MEKNVVEKEIELNAGPARVWRALTDHEEFGAWFRVKLEGPFEPGKKTSGRILHPGYEHLRWEVTVQRMDKEKLFSFTWHPYAVDPKVDYSRETPTLVEFHLEKLGEGTRLTVTESGFEKIPPHRQIDALRLNDQGWAIQVKNIEEYLREKP